MTSIAKLFQHIENLNYPTGMQKMEQRIKGEAFFPGGHGTLDKTDSLAGKDIMILGQDFDTYDNYKKSLQNGRENIENNPTWKNIRIVLKECRIDENKCFFTNAIMGARTDVKNTGKSPGFNNENFIKSCQEFFLVQLEAQKPKLILALGKYVGEFLADTSSGLMCYKKIKNFSDIDLSNHAVKQNITFKNGINSTIVLLTHPSYRNVNVIRRRFNKLEGHKAEIAMISAAFER